MGRITGSRIPAILPLKVTVPVANGGTGGQTPVSAAGVLNGVHKNALGTANGVIKRNLAGVIPPEVLPEFGSSDAPTISFEETGSEGLPPYWSEEGTGLLHWQAGYTIDLWITNFDSFKSYVFEAPEGVTISQVGNSSRLIIDPGSTIGEFTFKVNGKSFKIFIDPPVPNGPYITFPIDLSTGISTDVNILSTAFYIVSDLSTLRHAEWEWTDFNGNLLGTRTTVGSEILTLTNLPLNTQYSVRCRHMAENGQVSEWSPYISFTTKDGVTLGSLSLFYDKLPDDSNFSLEYSSYLKLSQDKNRVAVFCSSRENRTGTAPYYAGGIDFLEKSEVGYEYKKSFFRFQDTPLDQFATSFSYFDISDNFSRIAIIPTVVGTGDLIVEIFDFIASEWTKTATFTIGPANFMNDGPDISLSGNGNVLAVGRPRTLADNDAIDYGVVDVYRESGGSWVLERTIVETVPPGEGYLTSHKNLGFGREVKLNHSGTSLVIFETKNPRNIGTLNYPGGTIFIYDFSTSWELAKQIENVFDAGQSHDNVYEFSGDDQYLAIGLPMGIVDATRDTDWYEHGAVMVLKKSEGSYTQTSLLRDVLPVNGQYAGILGVDVALDQTGSTLAVSNSIFPDSSYVYAGGSNFGKNMGSGKVTIHQLVNGVVTTSYDLKPFRTSEYANFGERIALSSDGSTLIAIYGNHAFGELFER